MKNIFIKYGFLILLAISAVACMEEDEKYATLTEAPGSILISVPTNALPAPPSGQPQIDQPNINVVGGRFATTDDLALTITLPEGYSNLTISTVVTSSGLREQKASFSGVSGSVDWVFPVNTLNVGNAAPAAGTSVVLQMTASNDAGESTSKMFTVTVLDPLTLAATNPTTAYADSTITLTYSVPANTTLANVTKVDLLAKRGVKGIESVVKTNTYGDVRSVIDGKFTYKMPAENPSGALDTIFYRVRATYATGRTVAKSGSVRFINVPLAVTTTGVTLYNPAVTGANAARAGYDFGKLAYVAATGTEATKDIKLQVAGLDVGFTTGTGNATRFLKVAAAEYTAPTFQSLRKLFTDVTAVPVTVVPNVFVGDVYAIEIDGGTKSAKYGIFRVTAVTLTPLTDNADFITIDVKTK